MRHKPTLLVTGAIRDGREILWLLEYAQNLRSSGIISTIVFSTWKGEVDRVSDLRTLLLSSGITLVESDMPIRTSDFNPKANGHIFFQKAALYYGLQVIAPGSLVIKARTDLIKERLESCMATLSKDNHLSVVPFAGLTKPIRSPLYTHDVLIERPFYWDDIVFTGTREELLGMCDFTSKYDVIFDSNDCPAEIRFYAATFLENYPVLEYGFANWRLTELVRLLQAWAAKAGDLQPLPILLQSWFEAQFHILSRYLILPSKGADGVDLNSFELRDFFSGAHKAGIQLLPAPWKCHKICNQAILNLLKDSSIPLVEQALIELRDRLSMLDDNPTLRGWIPDATDMPAAEKETQGFAMNYGIELFRPERSRISLGGSARSVQFSGLNIPDRKPLSWVQQKRLGIKKLAEKKFFQWIST